MTEDHKPTGDSQHDDHLSDTVHLMGREITVYGGIYTVVFAALAVLTVIEVLVGGFEGDWKTIPLLAIAVAKAVLVVYFYMHLRSDSRVFAFTLALPLGITLLSILYLLAVPVKGY